MAMGEAQPGQNPVAGSIFLCGENAALGFFRTDAPESGLSLGKVLADHPAASSQIVAAVRSAMGLPKGRVFGWSEPSGVGRIDDKGF